MQLGLQAAIEARFDRVEVFNESSPFVLRVHDTDGSGYQDVDLTIAELTDCKGEVTALRQNLQETLNKCRDMYKIPSSTLRCKH
jgi:hypothetical protein